jgi:hypothetical protein
MGEQTAALVKKAARKVSRELQEAAPAQTYRAPVQRKGRAPQADAPETEAPETTTSHATAPAKSLAGIPVFAPAASVNASAPASPFLRLPIRRKLGVEAVQIHSGLYAEERAHAHGAAAYATGSEVYLGRGVDPTTDLGQRVLAHELTHVVQQERGRAGMPLASPASLESEASEVSGVGIAGASSGTGAAWPGSVQKWRRLHPRMATTPTSASQGGLSTVDEKADRAEREAHTAWREKRVQQAEATPAGNRDAALDQQLDKDVQEIKEQLDSFLYTNDDKIWGILWYWAQEPFQSGRVRNLYLDKLFRRLRNSKKEKGILATTTTNYYNMLFDDRDLAARVRDIRDHYAVEFKGVEASEISQSTEPEPFEQRPLPPTKDNLRKAKIVAQGLLGIPDEKQTQEERSLCMGIMREGGIDGGGERFLLTQYHAVTAEERERYQRHVILSAVMTVIDYYSIVLALEAPIGMLAEGAAAGAGLEELTSSEARSLELTGEREFAAQARTMTPELEANVAKRGVPLETQGKDIVPVEGTRNPEATGQGAHPEWEARPRSQQPLPQKKQTQTPLESLGYDQPRPKSGYYTSAKPPGMFTPFDFVRGLSEPEMHHFWPEYLGGVEKQTLGELSGLEHDVFHTELMNWKGGVFNYNNPSAAFRTMTSDEIYEALREFYTTANEGRWSKYMPDFGRAAEETLKKMGKWPPK